MTTQIKRLSKWIHRPRTVDINTIIHEHNNGTQIMLAALTDGTFCAMWSKEPDLDYETELLPEHFEYLCESACEGTDIWFDFDMHDALDVEPFMKKYPAIDHV